MSALKRTKQLTLHSHLTRILGATTGALAAGAIALQLGGIQPVGDVAIPGLLVAAALGLLGNLLRTARTKVLLDFGRPGDLFDQFLALNVGVLLNSAFPFRIGEVARSFLLARQLRMSLLYSLAAVVLERLVDVVVILGLFLLLGSATLPALPEDVILYALAVLVFAVALLGGFALLVVQNGLMLRTLWSFSRVWNPRISIRMKLSFWSLMHGLQLFLHSPYALLRYMLYTLLGWAAFLGAVAITAWSAWVPLSAGGYVIPFLVPDGVIGAPTLTGRLGTLSTVLESASSGSPGQLVAFGVILWSVLNVPEALLGLWALMTRRVYSAGKPVAGSQPLDRSQSLNAGMEHFLDSFYRRDDFARILHDFLLYDDVRIVRFFKGGSDALTTLVMRGGSQVVRKVVRREHAPKLAQQYQWLVQHNFHDFVAEPICEGHTRESYFIDIRYESDSIPLFQWVHMVDEKSGRDIVHQIWNVAFEKIYGELRSTSSETLVRKYIQERLVDRVQRSAARNETLAMLWNCEHLVINGQEYQGLGGALMRVLGDADLMATLSSYSHCERAHGDLTVDNVLVRRSGEFVLIDPSDDNPIRGPVIDFARMLQSFDGGYEFLNSLGPGDVTVESNNGQVAIHYPALRSAVYEKLATEVEQIAAVRLSSSECASLPFHVGLLFGRMMSHRIEIEPTTVAAYFGQCVIFINRFLEKYE